MKAIVVTDQAAGTAGMMGILCGGGKRHGTVPQIGDRITDKSAPPDEGGVRDWIGPQAFVHWVKLRSWIDASYPGVFAPEWLYGGKNRGWSLRYKKTKAFCTILPEYRRLSIVVVVGERNARNLRSDAMSGAHS
ncbi:DUF3788 family protein [Tunturiibacter gelidiferens]|uniref:DUF3788 family protein n=1 Tax=Tunturiibacter gelidiferens TaxID=3069689 RepID=UPI003D9AC77A